MTNKAVRYGIVGIAVILFVAVILAGAASADSVTINSVAEWNAFAAGSGNYSKDIVLGGDLDFTGVTIQPLNQATFTGAINGKYHTMSNFSISRGDANEVGLISKYSGSLISNLTISNFSVSGGGYLGGMVGHATSTSTFKNVIVANGYVTGSGSLVGGLVGHAYGLNKYIDNCTVENCGVSGVGAVGGLVGSANEASVSVNASCVNGCDISSVKECVGGLVGRVDAACAKFDLNNCEVVDCVIKSSTGNSGGCLGSNCYKESSTRTIDHCTVGNCAIYASSSDGSNPCGGIIGGYVQSGSPTEYPSVSNCTVEFCTIAGLGSKAAGGIAGSFPTLGTLDRNEVISSCIVSVSGKAAGICPTATTTS